jgi:hypothetical protein
VPDSTDAAGGGTAVEERLVLRALAALVAFVFASGVAVVLTRSDDDSAVVDDVPVVEGEPAFSGAGPLSGADVPTYVTARTDALSRAEGRVTAVVSFREYAVEREARTSLARVDVLGLLVAAPGGVPVVVTGGLDRWAARERADAEAELTNLATMLATTEDPDFRAEFETDMARLTGLLEHLDPRAPIVFGAVVQAQATELRALADRADVRLVDIVSREAPDDLVVLAGLRPEETERAGTPRTRPLS